MVAENGLVFVLNADYGPLPSDHMPAVLYKIFPSTGTAVPIILPVANDSIDWLGFQQGSFYLVAQRDTGLLNNHLESTLSSFRISDGTGAAELEDVAPGDWLNACQLIKTDDLRRSFNATYKANARSSPWLNVAFPEPVSCDYVSSDSEAPIVRITVAWVSRSAEDASNLLTSWVASPDGKNRLMGVGDQAFTITTQKGGPGKPTGRIVLRVRRSIVLVQAVQNPHAAQLVARQVSENLS
jgi:hypothetical protein